MPVKILRNFLGLTVLDPHRSMMFISGLLQQTMIGGNNDCVPLVSAGLGANCFIFWRWVAFFGFPTMWTSNSSQYYTIIYIYTWTHAMIYVIKLSLLYNDINASEYHYIHKLWWFHVIIHKQVNSPSCLSMGSPVICWRYPLGTGAPVEEAPLPADWVFEEDFKAQALTSRLGSG